MQNASYDGRDPKNAKKDLRRTFHSKEGSKIKHRKEKTAKFFRQIFQIERKIIRNYRLNLFLSCAKSIYESALMLLTFEHQQQQLGAATTNTLYITLTHSTIACRGARAHAHNTIQKHVVDLHFSTTSYYYSRQNIKFKHVRLSRAHVRAHVSLCACVCVVLLFCMILILVVVVARTVVTESDKLATLMRSQFHAYCFSLSEDRKAITIIFFDRSLSARKSVDFFAASSFRRHALASRICAAIYDTTNQKTTDKQTSIHQQVGQTTVQSQKKSKQK